MKRIFLWVSGLFLLVVVVPNLIFPKAIVTSASMQPTFLVGDHVVINPFSYRSSLPSRGDIVVFELRNGIRKLHLKRVIGLPGDRIEMKDGVIFINELEVSRTKIDDFVRDYRKISVGIINRYIETLPTLKDADEISVSYAVLDQEPNGSGKLDNTSVFTVPEDHFFVMGDHRDATIDSRGGLGYVPIETLKGRVMFILFSIDRDEDRFRYDRIMQPIS